MANDFESTTKFKVDISELKKSMQEAKRQVAVANSEFKAASSSMDDWTTSVDGLSAKLKNLDSNLENQKKILSNLERQYELTVAEMGEGSKAADDLKIKINNQKTVINNTEKEISKWKTALDELTAAEKDTGKAGNDMADAMSKAASDTDKAKDSTEKMESASGILSDTLGSLLKAGAAAFAAIGTAAAGALIEVLKFSDGTGKALNGFAAETGATTEEMSEFKDVMTEIYNNNLGESFDDIAQAMAEVKKQAGDIGAEELKEMTSNALVLRDTFDFEVNESMRAAKMLMDQFGLTGTEAYNLIAQGAQNGLDKNGDLLDSINEYSVHYAQAGYTAEDFFNSLKNGTDAGTFSVDKLGDAMKEFGIRTKDTATSTTDAFKALGYGAAASQEDIDKTKDKIKDLEEKLAEATETQEELNKKSAELSKTNVQKHEQKISSLTDTIENLEKQLKYANLEQENFNDKTSELTRIKNADKIAEYTKKLEEAKKQLAELTTGQTDFTDSSNEMAKAKNAKKIAEYSAEIEALKGNLSALESSTGVTAGSIAELQNRFAAGGDEAKSATEEVLKKLFEMENEVERNAVGVGLFGTMWEDLGADGIKALMDMNGEISLTNDALEQINSVKYNTLGEAMAGIGRNIQTSILMPISDTLIPKLTELQQKFSEWLNDPVTQAAIDNLATKISDFLISAIDDLITAVKWVMDNKDSLLTALAGIAAGFVAFNVSKIIYAAVTALKAMTAGTWALNTAMKANIIGIVIGLLTALVAAFIYLWNNSEAFRNFWIGLWENIKNFCGSAIESIVNFFTVTIPEAINSMITFFSELPAKISEWLTNTINNVVQWKDDMIAKAVELGKNFLDNIVTFFTELPYNLGYLLGMAIAKVIQWGIDLYTFATTKVPEFINKVVEFFKTLPSNVWTWLVNTYNKIKTWGTNTATKAKEVGRNFLNNVVSFFKNLPSNVSTWLSKVISAVSTWGSDLAQKGKDAAQKLFDNIVNTIKNLPSNLKSIGSDIVRGLWNGINNMSGWISGKIQSFGDGVLSGIKDFFGIHSPSKLMADEVGKFIPQGIAVGIEKNAKSVLNSMRDLTVNAVGSARNGLTGGGVSTTGSSVVNNFYQTNNSPKALSRLEIYRQSKNLLGYAGGV